MGNTVRTYSPPLVSRRTVLTTATGVLAAGAIAPRGFADANIAVGMRAYTAIFPGGAGIHFDHAYYRDRHLTAMQRSYGAALARVEMRKPVAGEGAPAAIVNFWIPDPGAFAKASAMHGQGMVEDKAHFTNSEQQVQGETVFGQVGASASAVRIGDQCLTVLYPYDARDRFDYDYYRDRHAPALLEMFGPAIARIEMRKGLMSTGGNSPPRFACTANIYVADTEAFAAAAPRSHQRVVDDIARFTSVTPISLMTEVLGAFDA